MMNRLMVEFGGQTTKCKEVILGLCRKLSVEVEEVKGAYLLTVNDEGILNYLKYLGDCDMMGVIVDIEEFLEENWG